MDGGCQCRQFRYRISAEPLTFYACHCRDCQNQSGSAFGLSLWVNVDEFERTSGRLQFFRLTGDSGRSKYCSFCGQCGTRIFHSDHPPEKPSDSGYLSLKAGTLDGDPKQAPVAHIWIRSAQPWVRQMLDTEGKMPRCFDTEPDDESILTQLWQQAHSETQS